MEISYKNNKLERQLTQPAELVKAFGPMARKVDQRMKDLKAAETLDVMKVIPGARCHELSGSRAGQLAVNITGNFRLVFEPDHVPIPKKEDGGLEWEKVTAIKIIEVGDYH